MSQTPEHPKVTKKPISLKERIRGSIFLSRDFSILLFALVVVSLGFGLMGPLLPEFRLILGISESTMGTLYALFAVAFVVAMPPSGYLVDRVGRKTMLVSGIVLFGFTTLALVFIRTPLEFAILRTLEGVGAAMTAPAAFALTVDLVPEHKRATALAATGTAELLGALAGPSVGGLVAGQFDFYYPFYVGAGAAFVCAAIVYMINEPKGAKMEERASLLTMFGAWKRNVEQNRKLVALTARGLVMGIVQGLFNLGLLWFWRDEIHMTLTEIGIAMSIGIAVMAVGSLPFGALSDKHGRVPFILMGGALMTVSLGLMAVVDSVWQVFVLVAIQDFGASMSNPSVGALLADVMSKDERGRVMGAYQTVLGIGNIIGFTVLGFVYDAVSPEAPILLCTAALAIATAIIALFVREPKRVAASTPAAGA
jgi:MFS family permease